MNNIIQQTLTWYLRMCVARVSERVDREGEGGWLKGGGLTQTWESIERDGEGGGRQSRDSDVTEVSFQMS